jgi:hypothetical protein
MRRGNKDLQSLEYGPDRLPPHVEPADAPSLQVHGEFMNAVRNGIARMLSSNGGDISGGLSEIVKAQMDKALHVTTTADRGLLRKLFTDMGQTTDSDPAKPGSSWTETVLADHTVAYLHANRMRIIEEVQEVAKKVGRRMDEGRSAKGIDGDDGIKDRYLDLFAALGDTLVPADEQRAFLHRAASRFVGGATNADSFRDIAGCKSVLLQRLKSFLESEVPSNYDIKTWKVYGGSEAKARQSMKELFFGVPPPSKL